MMSPKNNNEKSLSDLFVENNKFLPEKLFSVKKMKEFSLGIPIDDKGEVRMPTEQEIN